MQCKHVLWHTSLAYLFPLSFVRRIEILLEQQIFFGTRQVDDLAMIGEALDLVHGVVGVIACNLVGLLRYFFGRLG